VAGLSFPAAEFPILDPDRVKETIGKAITGINLGLDWHSQGNLQRAAQDLQRHYLQSFFQVGYSRIMDLQKKAQQFKEASIPLEPGSFLESFIEELLRKYPLLTEHIGTKIQKRFFCTRRDLEKAEQQLSPP